MSEIMVPTAPGNATTRVWIPATAFPTADVIGGSTNVAGYHFRHWILRLDPTTLEGVSSSVIVPADWSTYDVDLVWTNMAESSGNVVWRFDRVNESDGDAMANPTAGTAVTAAAPVTAGLIETTRLASGVTSPNTTEFLTFLVLRIATDAADTLANDAAILGVMLGKAA